MQIPDYLPENFRPKIVRGRIFPKGRNFVYKDLDSSRQLELPLSMADMILLCDGKHTIQQILTRVFEKQKVVQFQKILETLFLLHKKGLLENSQELVLEHDSNLLTRFLKYKKVMFTLVSGSSTPAFDRPKTLVLASILIFNAFLILHSLFLNSNGAMTLIFVPEAKSIFFTASIFLGIINLRSLVYFFLESFLFNIPPMLSFNVGPREIGFRTDLEGSVSELGTVQRMLYLMGYLAFPVTISMTLAPMILEPFSLFSHSLPLALGLIVLFDFFPHSKKSVGSAFLREFGRIPDSSDLTDFGLFLSKSGRKFEMGRSFAGLLWSLLSLAFFGILLEKLESFSYSFGPHLLLALGFLTILIYTHSSLSGMWESRPQFQLFPKEVGKNEIVIALDLLERVSLFSEIGETYLKALVEMSDLETIEAKTVIFKEGDEPKDLYLLVSGSCEVKNEILTAEINSGSVFGESALLESGLRQATVTTNSKVIVLKIPILKISEVLSQTGHLESLKSQIVVNQYFCSSKHFHNIRRSTIEKLERSGNIQSLGAGQVVFKQGDPGDGIYLIVRGSVEAQISLDRKSVLNQGDLFGEISVLARIPRTATVCTLEPSLLFKISPDSFWEVLLADLNLAYQIEKLSESRLSQDMDVLLNLEKVS